MGEIITTKINRFDGGIAKDKRSKISNQFAVTKHFDALTYPHKLVPYFDTEAIEDKTFFITKFLYNLERNGSTYYIYGFGKNAGTDKTRVYRISPTGSSWGSGANNISILDKKEGCFFYYKGYIYMFAGVNKLIRYDTSGATAFEDNVVGNVFAAPTLADFTSIAQAVHHPSDDVAYFFTDNLVHKLNNTVWEKAVLTLPDNLKIVDATPYGDYLAIACVTKGVSNVQSFVYLWDRDAVSWNSMIDFGDGELLYIANLDNQLIGVVDFFIGDSLNMKTGKMMIKKMTGGTAVIIGEIVSRKPTISQTQTTEKTKVVSNNKLYFPYYIPLDEDPRNGIWVIDSSGKAILDFIEEEVDLATNKTYQGIFLTGNKWWIAHSLDGSVNRGDPNSVYSATSIYESLINGGDRRLGIEKTKKLKGATGMVEAMPVTGKIVLKYQKDENIGTANWVTIFTNTTENLISHDAINIESNGNTLQEYKEIAFRIESTGGAVITGLKFKSEILEKNVY